MSNRMSQVCLVLISMLLISCASHPTVDSGSVTVENEDIRAVVVFTDSDREKISDYYRKISYGKKVPPGLAKKQELPPGLQKHIEKYGELPPGLQGRRLPDDLERSLSLLPSDYIRLKIGDDIVLMNQKTRVVFDIIWDLE